MSYPCHGGFSSVVARLGVSSLDLGPLTCGPFFIDSGAAAVLQTVSWCARELQRLLAIDVDQRDTTPSSKLFHLAPRSIRTRA